MDDTVMIQQAIATQSIIEYNKQKETEKRLYDFKEQQNYIITLQNIIIQQKNQLALKDQQIKNLMTMLQEERERNS